jgi:hypothetical protein
MFFVYLFDVLFANDLSFVFDPNADVRDYAVICGMTLIPGSPKCILFIELAKKG